MPNRYEREIEEILRNLEQTEPGQSAGQRFRRRPPARPQPNRRTFSPHFSVAEWLLLVAVAAALIGGGVAYIVGIPVYSRGEGLFTGILAVIGYVCLVLVALSQFIFQPRRSRSYRYGNTTITPIRSTNLWTNVKTRWNLFWLRRRYRRDGKE